MLEIDRPQTPEVRSAIERLRSRMNIGRLIVAARMRHGLTQAEIARRAGTKQGRVSELETLSGNATLETLDKIAMVLDLEVTLQERTQPMTLWTVHTGDVQKSYSVSGSFGRGMWVDSHVGPLQSPKPYAAATVQPYAFVQPPKAYAAV